MTSGQEANKTAPSNFFTAKEVASVLGSVLFVSYAAFFIWLATGLHDLNLRVAEVQQDVGNIRADVKEMHGRGEGDRDSIRQTNDNLRHLQDLLDRLPLQNTPNFK